MDIIAELKRVANEIAAKFPGHAKTLSQAANELEEGVPDEASTDIPSKTVKITDADFTSDTTTPLNTTPDAKA